MTENKKTIIVFGEPENEKLILVDKLLKDGLRVKSCAGNIFYDVGSYWDDEKKFFSENSARKIYDESRLRNIITGCEGVICCDYHRSNSNISKDNNYVTLESILGISRKNGVQRFIYSIWLDVYEEYNDAIDHNDKVFTEGTKKYLKIEEYLKKTATNDFIASVIRYDYENFTLPEKKLQLSAKVFANNYSQKCNINVIKANRRFLREKLTDNTPVKTRDWNTAYILNDMKYYHYSLNQFCSYFLQSFSNDIVNKYWLRKLSIRITLESIRILELLYRFVMHPRASLNRFLNVRMLMRLKDVLMMMILFHFWPGQVYRFSTRIFIPPKNARYPRTAKPDLPFFKLIKSKTSNILKMDEISIVMRGKSFNVNQLNNIKQPIFMAGMVNPAQVGPFKKIIDKYNIDVTWVYGAGNSLRRLAERGFKVICLEDYIYDNYGEYTTSESVDTLWLRQNCKVIATNRTIYPQPKPAHISWPWIPTGSGLAAIGALYHFANKINVYGWDFHLNISPNKMSYPKLLLNMYDYECDKRSRNHFESMMINLYYGYHLSKFPNVNVYGYLGQLERHKKMIDRIERVLFD